MNMNQIIEGALMTSMRQNMQGGVTQTEERDCEILCILLSFHLVHCVELKLEGR